MRTLYFEINGQTLRKIDNFSGIIKGSKQYLKCHFAVKDPEWTGMGIVAVFEIMMDHMLLRFRRMDHVWSRMKLLMAHISKYLWSVFLEK